MEWFAILALVLGALIGALPVAFVAFLTVGGVIGLRGTGYEKAPQCTIDTDCGLGFVCRDGTCVPSNG
jgi:Cys-rich repeat protein